MDLKFVRMFRTESSERFLIESSSGEDLGLFDLHFLTEGSVSATLVLLDPELAKDESAELIINQIDAQLLPSVSLDEKDLNFTVVKGELVGTFTSDDK